MVAWPGRWWERPSGHFAKRVAMPAAMMDTALCNRRVCGEEGRRIAMGRLGYLTSQQVILGNKGNIANCASPTGYPGVG